MNNALVQTNSSMSYVDARWRWDRACFQLGQEVPDVPVYSLQQANARAILNREWDHHRQTSRSTYKWDHKELFDITVINKLTASDYRSFIIDKLDADVYSPFCSPGIHAVPKEFTQADHIIINCYPWGKTEQDTILINNGEAVERKQVHSIHKWEAQIVMTRTKDGCHFHGITPSGNKHFHSKEFVSTVEYENRRSSSDWKREIIDECSRRLFEGVFKTNDLEEIWLSKDDVIIEKEIDESDESTRYYVAFYYINVEQPTKADVITWKKEALKKEIERARQEGVYRLRNPQRHVNIGRSRSFTVKTPPELKALKTLRDLITERDYRRYLTNGFIMVKGKSGLYYQIFCDNRNIQVWKNNQKAFSICIHTDKSCPPTDHVINCKLLIEFDEQEVWKNGNVSGELGRMMARDNLVDSKWHLVIEGVA